MKTGTGQFAPFQWTNENLFDMRSSLFKMADGKKQKSTKLHQNLCCSACWKEMSRHYGLGNRCTSTSCHSATMTILAMHLISRWNWNGKCYGKSGSLSQKVERYFSLLIQLIQFVINGQSMVSNDVNRWQTDFWPPNHWRTIFPTMSPLFSQMSPLFLEPWDIVPSYEISRQNTALSAFLQYGCILTPSDRDHRSGNFGSSDTQCEQLIRVMLFYQNSEAVEWQHSESCWFFLILHFWAASLVLPLKLRKLIEQFAFIGSSITWPNFMNIH